MINKLRDILYFDFDKAASLISQIEGGLSQQRTEGAEEASSQRNIRKYNLLKVFIAEFGGIESEKKTILETKVLHHDLLLRLEEVLFDENFALDVNELESIGDQDAIREKIGSYSYLRSNGWCAIEDFDRIYEISKHFNSLLAFVRRSELNGTHGFDEKEAFAEHIATTKGRNSKEHKQAVSAVKDLEKKIKEEIEVAKLPSWLFDGIQTWIDTLSRHRLNIRMVPFEQYPELQVIANLKRECFVDDDLEHLLYGYGSQPNKKLSVLGLVTSIPPREEHEGFDIYHSEEEEEPGITDAEDESEKERVEVFEKAFQALFPAIQGMEKFTSYHHYPRVVIHPIAVYRDIKSGE